jgi:hypothetical protein
MCKTKSAPLNPLARYLDRSKVKQADLASIAAEQGWRISQAQISRIATGKRAASFPVRAAFHVVTGGAVAVSAWK